MKIGKKIGIILLSSLLVVFVLAGSGLFLLNRYLNSSDFLDQVKQGAREKAGLNLALGSLSVDVFRGVKVKDISIAAPQPGHPPAAEAGEIEITYRVGDLWQKKLTIEEIRVVRPRLRLGESWRGSFHFPQPSERKGGKGGKRRSPGEKEEGWTASVSGLTVEDGAVELATGTAFDPVEAEGVDASLRFSSPGMAEARMTIASARWKNREVLTRGSATAHFSGLDPEKLSGRVELTAAATILDPFSKEKKEDQSAEIRLGLKASAREGEAKVEEFQLRAPGAEIAGNLAASLLKDAIPIEGVFTFVSSDVGEIFRRFLLVNPPPVRGEMRGEFTLSGEAVPGLIPLPEMRGRLTSSVLAFPSLGILGDIEIPISVAGSLLKAETATAALAGGTLTARAETNLAELGVSPFRASFQAEGIDLDRLFRESPYSRDPSLKGLQLAGTVWARGTLTGDSTGLRSLKGQTKIVATGGSVSGYFLQDSLAKATGQDWLKKIEFEQAEAKISCREGIVALEGMTMKAGRVKIVSRGTIDLNRAGYLDLRVGLLFPPDLAAEIQPKAFRLALEPIAGEKNLVGIEFGVFGPPNAPRTDFLEVLAKKAISGLFRRE
ncbi:MAG: hypothetical protein NTV79_07880 [Candidatus Aureabacteria bacterium]|nr:hypothetical protein [Candidatus Auribacterota bacterium]